MRRYRLADGVLELADAPEEFLVGFDLLFAECALAGDTPPAGPALRARFGALPGGCAVSLEGLAPSATADEHAALARATLATRGAADSGSSPPSVSLASGAETRFDGPGAFRVEGDDWPSVVGSLLVAELFALQQDVAVFHAASLVIAGRGVLLAGDKARGKTTTALALAARGNVLAGDELAAIRLGALELLPLRRCVAIRPGPRSARVDALLAQCKPSRDVYPDGSPRLRIAAGDLFGTDAAPPAEPGSLGPLGAVCFLEGFADEPRIEPFRAGRADLARLELHPASLSRVPAMRRAMALAKILGRVRCYRLELGAPDETAERIEHTLQSDFAT